MIATTSAHVNVVGNHASEAGHMMDTSARGQRPLIHSLASLRPQQIAPPAFSQRTLTVLALRRIECLQIVPHDHDHHVFRVQVFFKSPDNHITLQDTHQHQYGSPTTASRPPDLVVDKSLADFMKLRDELFQLARHGHGLELCAFCVGVIEFCGYGRVKPHWSMTWLHSAESVCDKLTLFMNDALDVVLKAKAFASDHCAGQERVPVLLYRFLGLHQSSPR